jgi:hypothetical protein
LRVSEGASDVEFRQPAVEIDRGVEALGERIEGSAKRPDQALPAAAAPPGLSSCCMETAAMAKLMTWRV